MNRNRILPVMLVIAMMIGVLAGCGQTVAPATEGISKETPNKSVEEAPIQKDIVILDFYIMNTPSNDRERIMEKANEIIEKELGVHLNLIMINKALYADKMNLMIQTKEPWDLCFTANWGGINFFENAQRGAYADLTQLIPEYAKETYERIPAPLWDGVKIDGKIYALVNYQQWGAAIKRGFRFRKDIVEETGFNWQEVKGKTMQEALPLIEAFLEEALKRHPDMIGFETSAVNSMFANHPYLWNMEEIGDAAAPGWISYEAPDTVINQFETNEYAFFCRTMHEWYEKGYVRKDGATLKDTYMNRKEALYVAEISAGWPDCIDFPEYGKQERMSMCTVENGPAWSVSITDTVIPAGAASTAAIAVNEYSPHKVEALKLIELLNTNDELYLLLTEGEEGTDYVYGEDGTYVRKNEKYDFNFSEWQLGQSYSPDFTRALYDRNESGDNQKNALEMIYRTEEEAKISPLTGFVFNTEPVRMELINCKAVIDELQPVLSSGSADPDVLLPEFLKRLKEAGVDKIIAEKQRQLDKWNISK